MKKDRIVKDLTRLIPATIPAKVKISNDVQYEKSLEIFKSMKDRQKIIQDKKNSILNPLNVGITELRELFRPFETEIGQYIELLKTEIERYLNEREQAKNLLTTSVNKDRRLKDPSKIQDKLEDIDDKYGRKKGTRSNKVPSIVDAGLIPDEYWVLDMTLIAKDLKEGKPIPGVELVNKIIITTAQ